MRPDHNRNWVHAVLFLNSESEIFNFLQLVICPVVSAIILLFYVFL